MFLSHVAKPVYHSGALVIPVILSLLLPSPFPVFGFFLVPFFYLTRWLALGRWIPETRVNALIALLLAMTAVGFLISSARDLAVLTAAPLIAGVTLFFYLTDRLNTTRDFSIATRGLALLGLALALAAPLTTDASPSPYLGTTTFAVYAALPRIFNNSNPNIVAGGLAILAPFALALIVQKSWGWRVVGAAAFAAMGFSILLLDSRGALFALGLGVAVWATLYQRWVLPLIPLGLIAVLTANQILQGPSVAQFVFGQIGTPKGGTLIERQTMWAQAALLIRASPFFGIGLGAYPRIAPFTFPYSPQDPGPSPNHVHNTFFQVALDTGVAGAVSFIALLFSGIYFAWRAYRAGIERDTAIALLAAFTIVLVHGLGDTIVWGTAKTGLFFWILQGVGISFDKASKVV